jgi:hypothetical protein
VPRGASKAEVKKKYFELAKKYHPVRAVTLFVCLFGQGLGGSGCEGGGGLMGSMSCTGSGNERWWVGK